MIIFLASQDAQEVMWVSESCFADLTDVTLVSDDTFRRLYWWSDGDGDGDGDNDGDETCFLMFFSMILIICQSSYFKC